MGLFDTVHCEYPLPDARHQGLEYQTKDLECLLDNYTITRDGRLVRHASRFGGGPGHDIEWPLHGDISIYTSVKGEDPRWVEYVVRFTHGRVEWVRPLPEGGRTGDTATLDWDLFPPAKQEPAESKTSTARDAEESLLQSLRRARPELEKLLTSCSDHWGYEDPVYRFYHQSFKVYGLQHVTRSIVQKLQALAPDLPLNPWFLQIVEAGTGKAFRQEDNARWTEMTRPILEAFFHARFFLEMAVRYANTETPPQMLPSGYAALLYLFDLR